MIDTALAQLLTTASELPPIQVRPSTELVRVTDGVTRILFTLIDAPRTYNDGGVDGIVSARYQVDYFGPQLSVVRTLAGKVREALDDHKGTQDDTVIVRISFPGSRFGKADADPGANNTTARFTHDVVVTYREP